MKKHSEKQEEIFTEVASLIKKAYEVMTSDPEECIRLAQKALKISLKTSFRRGIAHGHMHIGLGKFHQGELAAALQEYKLAEAIFLEDDDSLGLRSVYNNIGVIYLRWKDRDKGLEYFQKNLALSDIIPNPKLNCTILVNLGGIHHWSKDHEEAMACFQKALSIARECGFKYGEALALTQIGELLFDYNKYDQAIIHLDEAHQIRLQTNDLSGIITILCIRARIELAKQNLSAAMAHYHETMRIAIEIKDKHSIAYSALKLAEVYHDLGNSDQEKQHLELCIELSSQHLYRDLETHALRMLAHWHEQAGDYKTALESYWKYQDVKNYIIDQNRNDTIQQLRVQMQVEEKEREMALIRHMNQALEKKNRQINRQKNRLERAEKALTEWNHNLELRVAEEMEKRYKQEQLLIQKSKLESLGRMAAGIAHEINQPLGMISIGIQNLLNKVGGGTITPEYMEEKSRYFNENLERISQIIEHVRLFSRDQQDDKSELVDLRDAVRDAISMLSAQFKDYNIMLSTTMPEIPVWVLGNKYRLEQVILNLLSNARDACEEKFDLYDDSKSIRISLQAEAQWASLEVEDNGCGIPADKQELIFEPFYTTKSESMGTGLGLSICYGIVNDLGGTLSCASKTNEGTRMRLELPLVKGAS